MQNGCELLNAIEKKGSLSESDVIHVIQTVMHTLQYVHESGHAHGDIRAENIWVPDGFDFTKLKMQGFASSQANTNIKRFN
jgi:serine/threonine protein kinase